MKSKIALIFPAMVLGLVGLIMWAVIPGNSVSSTIYAANQPLRIPNNVKFQLGPKPLTELQKKAHKQVSWLQRLDDIIEPPADATAPGFISPTVAITPGSNINLQLASPQASAAYVACNFALGPICRIYVNATISTLAFYNGVDGADYTVEIIQNGTGFTVAVPTQAGTPAGISTQVNGWAVGGAPLASPMALPTAQAGAITTWKMIYDSSVGSFIVYSVN